MGSRGVQPNPAPIVPAVPSEPPEPDGPEPAKPDPALPDALVPEPPWPVCPGLASGATRPVQPKAAARAKLARGGSRKAFRHA